MTNYLEDKQLPIYILFGNVEKYAVPAKIINIRPRTRCTRVYSIRFADGKVLHYKGASTRPAWLKHIIKESEYNALVLDARGIVL
jgi:hypothetical protein